MMLLVVALIAMVAGGALMRALDVERYSQLLAERQRRAVEWRRQALHAAAVADRYWLYVSEVYERAQLVPLPTWPVPPLPAAPTPPALPEQATEQPAEQLDDCVLARIEGDRRVCLDPACDRCFGTAGFPAVLVPLPTPAADQPRRPILAVVEVAS